MNNLQKKIVNEMKVLPTIDVHFEIYNRTRFLEHMLLKSGMETLVLGISGGVDSTVAGRLCQTAVNNLNRKNRTDKYRFIAVRLPHYKQADEDDAQAALDFIKPTQTMTVDIGSAVTAIHAHVTSGPNRIQDLNPKVEDFHKGNVKARMRMIAQYEIAGLNRGLVVGTDHSAENITGFFTKHGDGACDIAPLFGLCKGQIREIAMRLGASEVLFSKAPTADLEEGDMEQYSDEDSLGVTYDEIDAYLKGEVISPHAAAIIENHYNRSKHKRVSAATIYDEVL